MRLMNHDWESFCEPGDFISLYSLIDWPSVLGEFLQSLVRGSSQLSCCSGLLSPRLVLMGKGCCRLKGLKMLLFPYIALAWAPGTFQKMVCNKCYWHNTSVRLYSFCEHRRYLFSFCMFFFSLYNSQDIEDAHMHFPKGPRIDPLWHSSLRLWDSSTRKRKWVPYG